jgi:hypothetical protein
MAPTHISGISELKTRIGVPANHKVGRVLGLFYSRRNWDSPTPSPAGECVSPPLGAHSLVGEGGRGGGGVLILTRAHTYTSIIFLSRVLCLCVCVSQFVSERFAILLVLLIKLTKETRRRD